MNYFKIFRALKVFNKSSKKLNYVSNLNLTVYFYQVCFPENFIFVDPLLEADGDGLAAPDRWTVRRPPDLDDGDLSTHLQVLLDDVTDLRLGHRRMLLNSGIGFHSVKDLNHLDQHCTTLTQIHQHFTSSFFVRKYFMQLLCAYSLGLKFFWQKEIGAKAAHKMLVKLTTMQQMIALCII